MHLQRLTLHNFKSYEQASFDFSSQLNVIHGLNGAGKTNLLDAIYMLSMTKSFFSITDQQLIRASTSFFRLEGSLMKTKEHLIVAKLQRGKKKILEVDGHPCDKFSDHIGFMPCIMIAPDDILLVNGGNTDRRRFIDGTLSQIYPGYLNALLQYNRLLRQRNALLKSLLEQGKKNDDLVEVYSQKMQEPAESIHQYRKEFFEVFGPLVNKAYEEVSNAHESITLSFHADLDDLDYLAMVQSSATRDRMSGRTSKGPHKDKLELKIDGKAARTFGSQGQKKSLVFALKLAQYQWMSSISGFQPILLLDDIFDKLDLNRVAHLLQIVIKSNFGQIFITDTQKDRIEPLIKSLDVTTRYIEIIGKKPETDESE